MPSSNLDTIPAIISIVRQLKPTSVLDVGAGYGKYGFLIREYLDQFSGQLDLHAVEANSELPIRQLRAIYSDIFFADWLLFTPYRRYDLVLMIDVIEHWSREDGFKALDKALEAGKKVLVSTPRNPAPQHGQWEEHKSKWSERDFKQRYEFKNHSNRLTVIGVITAKSINSIDK